MKILVIIPAYNEEATIKNVIQRIKLKMPQADILVVNDGSKDNTSRKAKTAGAKVIDLPYNLGIGGAMQTGYLYAKENGYDIAVQVDGDGQHDPSYIKELIEPIINNSADVVVGSRYISKTNYKSSVFRRMGMIFFSFLVSTLTNQKFKDTTSGFRAVNKEVINYFSNHYPVDYPEVDVLIRLKKRNFRIAELPVEMYKRQGGKSSITTFRSLYYMLKVSLAIIIGTLRSSEE
ncbi:MAG TPA: glycosyltransferase family 2 protein [Hungateiclostridium thermocellum]|jgi:glycosyltransferase involved in cell wall biosynthesis|uniref:Glycosyl transferase family 2 n=2 Tax=Acetivibrio thermocellus TaxID=1515 RepID=A3DK15_ACET2|nr:glycosyltransferase family 2 protein [Acetivibrio thermocellus]ABN54294.1 glycosyl transferase family 2 [Acetivibrio thermocellus ATCC 27405]ADU73730.1 glycosyl transferase family 2 [Acetivibrio thermocellus DSM 1313]ALX07660.1 glycosyl transferase family 2 [Acetivibrio thermocellus AD2]ANV75402.1 glycosyl transferase family 2 [Acetivibrio thermocellus DSM 2360]EIC03381.1 glycosyl transferase family 2 [Acetivibrio thermocellus YS]